MRNEVKDLYLIKKGIAQWAWPNNDDRLKRAATLEQAIKNLKIRKVPWNEIYG